MDLQLLKQETQFFLLPPRRVRRRSSNGMQVTRTAVGGKAGTAGQAVSLFNKLVQPGVYV